MTSAMDLINKLNFEQRQKSTALRQYIKENRVTWLGGVKKAPRWETGEMQGELVELLDG